MAVKGIPCRKLLRQHVCTRLNSLKDSRCLKIAQKHAKNNEHHIDFNGTPMIMDKRDHFTKRHSWRLRESHFLDSSLISKRPEFCSPDGWQGSEAAISHYSEMPKSILFTKRKMAWEWSDPCLDKLRLFMWKSIFLFYSHAIDQIPRVLSWIIPFSPQFLSIHQFTTWLVAGGGPLGWLSCQILELQTAESCSPAS